jgi:putative GTP pyrophosphokinase
VTLSRTQIDKLGDRLTQGDAPSADDLVALNAYELLFEVAQIAVVRRVRESTGLVPSVRPLKTSGSIVAKLRRQSTRLSTIQDIAGCRLTVDDIREENSVTSRIQKAFASARIQDLRKTPHHGYRAVHIIVRADDRRVEIQVRTHLQHLWAQLSEKLADRLGPDVKYGGGPDSVRQALLSLSSLVGQVEGLEAEFVELNGTMDEGLLADVRRRLEDLRSDVAARLTETLLIAAKG